MRRLVLVTLVLAVGGVLTGPASPSQQAPQLTCKYGFKYVTKKVHGHKKRVKVCKKKPKPKPPAPRANVELTMSSTLDQVTAGNHVSYSVQVENEGPATADATTVTVDLPSGDVDVYAYGGSSEGSECAIDKGSTANHVECKFGMLGVESDETPGLNAYAFLSIRLAPTQAGDYTVSAKATSSTLDPSPQDASAARALRVLAGPARADLSVAIVSPPQPGSVPGGYDETLSVTNHGPTEATDVVVTILLPQGSSAFVPVPLELDIATLLFSQCPPFAYGYLSTAIACFTSVGSGETRTATLHVEPSIHSPASLRTDAVVSSYTRDSSLENNRASADAAVDPFTPVPGVDLRLAFDQPPALQAGRPLALPFRLANLGLADVDDVTVEAAVLPSVPLLELGLQTSNQAVGCSSTSDGQIDCRLAKIESDARISGVIYAESVAAGTYTATVTVTSPDLAAPVTATQTFQVK